MRKYLPIFVLSLCAVASAERFEFSSDINREIPDNDSTGIRDTVFIDQHIEIDDINIFVGIGTEHGPAEDAMIDIFSPSRHVVRLNLPHHLPKHFLFLLPQLSACPCGSVGCDLTPTRRPHPYSRSLTSQAATPDAKSTAHPYYYRHSLQNSNQNPGTTRVPGYSLVTGRRRWL